MSNNEMVQAKVVVSEGRAGIVYSSEESARKMADELNARRGYAPVEAVLTQDGWTVNGIRRN